MKQAAGPLLLSLALVSCGGDGDGNANFSKDYAAEIQKDCNESVQCFLQRDEQIEDDPFNECLKDSSAMLDGDAELQGRFLRNFNRCNMFVVCDYYDCASSGASTYADSQVPRIQQRCQAESECRTASGMPDANPTSAIDSCVYIKAGELNALTAQQQRVWETAFLRCSMTASCDFVNCFATAMSM
jgi:hypothetical protein